MRGREECYGINMVSRRGEATDKVGDRDRAIKGGRRRKRKERKVERNDIVEENEGDILKMI